MAEVLCVVTSQWFSTASVGTEVGEHCYKICEMENIRTHVYRCLK